LVLERLDGVGADAALEKVDAVYAARLAAEVHTVATVHLLEGGDRHIVAAATIDQSHDSLDALDAVVNQRYARGCRSRNSACRISIRSSAARSTISSH
jgi:hypothetical protein